MGALCGKESPASSDPFSTPGRVLSSAPAPQTTSSIPAQRKVGGPPRTLGGSSSPNTDMGNADSKPIPESRPTTDSTPNIDREEARRKAAEAAMKRDQQSKKASGQLGKNLREQKTKSQKTILEEEAERRLRERQVSEATEDAYATQR